MNTCSAPSFTQQPHSTLKSAGLALCVGLLLVSRAWAGTDINQASEADLDSLHGVGPALSARILAQRAQQPFTDWADLMQRVKGLRTATARRLSGQGLTVNGQAFEPPATEPHRQRPPQPDGQ